MDGEQNQRGGREGRELVNPFQEFCRESERETG